MNYSFHVQYYTRSISTRCKIHVCTHTHARIHTNTHARTHVRTHARTHAHTHTHTRTHTHTHTDRYHRVPGGGARIGGVVAVTWTWLGRAAASPGGRGRTGAGRVPVGGCGLQGQAPARVAPTQSQSSRQPPPDSCLRPCSCQALEEREEGGRGGGRRERRREGRRREGGEEGGREGRRERGEEGGLEQ